jgi:RNA polymerase sigma-70 factor (ECF subfamily)
MENKRILFNEQEKIFKERTGNDFSTMYKKYYTKLVYFTSRICNNPQKAEDISTDSFLTAFEKINKYEIDKSQFSTWLFTIAKNIALQDIKAEKRNISIDIEYDNDGTTMKDFIYNIENENTSYDIIKIKSDIMKSKIRELKDPYRKVIEMRELQKMSYKDISKNLNKNLSTIKSQIRNGRILLKKQTENDFKKIEEMY